MINHIETEKKIMDFAILQTRIGEEDIRSANRNVHFVRARAIYAYLMRLHGFSYPEIGTYLNRDHTSISHLVKKYIPSHGIDIEIADAVKASFPSLYTGYAHKVAEKKPVKTG